MNVTKALSSTTQITTSITAEWVWVAGRLGAATAGVVGALTFLGGTTAQGVVLGSAITVFAYDAALAFFLLHKQLARVFWLGSILDNLMLLISWFAVAQSQAGADRGIEEYLILFPVLGLSAARFGILLGLLHTTVWVGIFATTTLLYYPPNGYDVVHLPTRLIVLMVTTALTLVLVTRLTAQSQQIQALAEEAQAQRDAVTRLNDDLEQRVDERTKQLRDLTSRLEGALGETARERASLQAIQKSMSEGLVVLNGHGEVQYLNPAAATLLHVPAAFAPGRPLCELLASTGTVPQQLLDMLPPKEAPSTAVEPIVVQWECDEGRQRKDLALTRFDVPLGNKELLSGLLVRDVTKERDLDRQRNAFVSIASHELRTPLTCIVGYTELLLRSPELDPDHRTWIETMSHAGKSITTIVSELLDISRIHTGAFSLSQQPARLEEIVDEALTYVGPLAEGHELRKAIPEDLPLVLADRAKLLQVLVNLLSNGVKYSPDKGPVTVRARTDTLGSQVVISVEDQGLGIASEDAAQLFTTFHRIRRPETVSIQGAGLGLYIVKQFIEMMDGEIWVESELNRGSTFHVALPAHVQTAQATSAI